MVFSFAILVISSSTRSLQLSQFLSPTEGTHNNIFSDMTTYRFNRPSDKCSKNPDLGNCKTIYIYFFVFSFNLPNLGINFERLKSCTSVSLKNLQSSQETVLR